MIARVALLLVACVLATPAWADDPPEKKRARALLQEGNARYAESDFAGALALFRQAYSVFPSPKLLVNTAACEKQLGQIDRAVTDLAEYLRAQSRDGVLAPDDRVLMERARADLDELEPRVGRIVMPEGRASLEVDGAPSGVGAYVMPGEHRVILREPGFDTYSTIVRVAARSVVEVRRPAAAVAPLTVVPPVRQRPRWVLPVAIGGSVVVLGLSLGLGLGLGLHETERLSGDLGTVTFMPK